MSRAEFADELFEFDLLDASATTLLSQRFSSLPVLEPFWTIEKYRELDFDFWSPDYECPRNGRYMKHGWMSHRYLHHFGHVLATREVMDLLASQLRGLGPVLDAGCGSGYLAKELARLGIETFAVDNGDYRLPIHQRDAQGDAAAHVTDRFGAVLMTWPPFGESFAVDVARAMVPGQLLIYEGENGGGCTADSAFFDYVSDRNCWERRFDLSAALDAVHLKFSMNRDHWLMFRKVAP